VHFCADEKVIWSAATRRRFQSADMSAHSKNKKATRKSGLFNFWKTPGQAGFGSTTGAAGFLALATIFLRLM
jgi:hypothetical protein